MKIYSTLFTCFIPLLFLASTCAKDNEETYDEETDYMEVNYGKGETVTKEMAIENWEQFLKQSQELIDITETNIGSLEAKIELADEADKNELQQTINTANLTLLNLKARRIKRNKEFSNDLKQFDPSVQQTNEAFKKQFKRDMFDLNIELENLLEKSHS